MHERASAGPSWACAAQILPCPTVLSACALWTEVELASYLRAKGRLHISEAPPGAGSSRAAAPGHGQLAIPTLQHSQQTALLLSTVLAVSEVALHGMLLWMGSCRSSS
jgi:hypothetical protein